MVFIYKIGEEPGKVEGFVRAETIDKARRRLMCFYGEGGTQRIEVEPTEYSDSDLSESLFGFIFPM